MIKSFFFSLKPEQKIITAIVSVLILFGAIKSAYYTVHYGGIDLRQRVVAARVLNSEESAYFFKWSPGQSERLIDENVRKNLDINGVTVAPGGLYVQKLFSSFNYPLLRMVWSVFQYLLLIAIFIFFLGNKKVTANNKFLIFSVGGIFFLCSPIWFLNIERGQIYILYAFLFCSIFFLYKSTQPFLVFVSGLLIAIAIYCRPTFAVLLVPLILVYKRTAIFGFICAAIPLLFHAVSHLSLWKDYFTAVETFTGLRKIPASFSENHVVYPVVIEAAKNLSLYKNDFICGGLRPLDQWFALFHFQPASWFYVLCYFITAIGLIIICRKIFWQRNFFSIFLFSFLLYMLAEYIMPAPRGAYNLIQWILPVLLMLAVNFENRYRVIFLITGLCFINGFPFYFPFVHDIGELILIGCLLHFIRKFKPAETDFVSSS